MTKTFYRLILLLICASLCIASGPGSDTGDPILDSEPGETDTGIEGGWAYGELQYPHDIQDRGRFYVGGGASRREEYR